MDIVTEEFRERKRGEWEEYKEAHPCQAWRCGPPSWMVLEEWRGEKIESYLDAAERLKAREFPGGYEAARRIEYERLDEYGREVWARMGASVPVGVDIRVLSTVAEVLMCEKCGQKARARGRGKCWGCIKEAQRKKEEK